MIKAPYFFLDDRVPQATQRDLGMDQKELGLLFEKIADALEFQAKFLERGCRPVNRAAGSLTEFSREMLHHLMDEFFLVGKVIEECSCIDSGCFCDLLGT